MDTANFDPPAINGGGGGRQYKEEGKFGSPKNEGRNNSDPHKEVSPLRSGDWEALNVSAAFAEAN